MTNVSFKAVFYLLWSFSSIGDKLEPGKNRWNHSPNVSETEKQLITFHDDIEAIESKITYVVNRNVQCHFNCVFLMK